MSYVVKINNQEISLEDIENPFVEIDWQEKFTISFDKLNQYEKDRILLIGFPLENTNKLLNYLLYKFGIKFFKKTVRNIYGYEIYRLKYTLNHQPGLCIIYKVIENMNNYKFVLILPPPLDYINFSYVKDFVFSTKDSYNKVILFDIINQPKFEFEIKDGVRIR